MSSEYRMRMKKSAQDGTTVTLIPDGPDGEGRPLQLAMTQAVLTFAATPTLFYGAAAGDGRKFELILRPVT